MFLYLGDKALHEKYYTVPRHFDPIQNIKI